MKHILTLSLVLLSCYCMAQKEETDGRHKKKEKVKSFRAKIPDGMKYVPSGAFKMQGGDGGSGDNAANTRTIQMVGYYMDATEITNQEYRQFVNWVRDSIANTLLGNMKTMPDGTHRVVMKKIDWKDAGMQERLAPMYLTDAVGNRRLNVSKLMYRYSAFDYRASKLHPRENAIKYIVTYDIMVYPDTTVFSKPPFTSLNNPLAAHYFQFADFNDYPVVGVSLRQCNAFCDWRTRIWKAEHGNDENVVEASFRIPTEGEWEWAARGGSDAVTPFLQPASKSIAPGDDLFTSPAKSYEANNYGLYNMAGNVSEWTASRCRGWGCDNDESDFAGSQTPIDKKKFVVRGGNWSNNAPDQQIGASFLQHVDSSNAYTGFRCVFSEVYMGVKK